MARLLPLWKFLLKCKALSEFTRLKNKNMQTKAITKAVTVKPTSWDWIGAIPKFKSPKLDPSRFPWGRYLMLAIICAILAGMMYQTLLVPDSALTWFDYLTSMGWLIILVRQKIRNFEARGFLFFEILAMICNAADAANNLYGFWDCVLAAALYSAVEVIFYYWWSKMFKPRGGDGQTT